MYSIWQNMYSANVLNTFFSEAMKNLSYLKKKNQLLEYFNPSKIRNGTQYLLCQSIKKILD